MGEKENSRLSLADQFFALATGGTEAAMRSSLSRLYYASYHLAAVLTDGKSHGDIAKRLADKFGDVGERFRSFEDLRSKMDYRPDFFETELRGKNPQIWFQDQMREGIGLYDQLREIWNRGREKLR
jgi:hypothetical protein